MRKLLIILLVFLLASCSLPFGGKKKTEKTPADDQKTSKIEETAPKPGDIKMIQGVEYIYAKNRRFMVAPYEPEYVWIRKDQYSPGLFETLTDRLTGNNASNKKEQDALQTRLTKLEEQLKNRNTQTQVVYAQPGGLPGVPYASVALPTFSYPSPKMKRKVLVLGLSDKTNYKEEGLDSLATNRLITRLEATGTIICIDRQTVNVKDDLFTPEAMKTLNEVYGVQAVIKGALSDVYVSTSRVEGKGGNQVSQAMSTISLGVYNTETGRILRQLSARNPVGFTMERGEMSPERVKVRAVDLAIELVVDDLLKTILGLDWHGRIAGVENQKIFLNAGGQSGLQKGDILEVYSPGTQIIDKATNEPLGRTKGEFRGELEVSETFGLDAAWAVARKPSTFAPTDLVYLKK